MIEVLKLALEALETELSIDWTNNDEFNASAEKMHKAIAAIKEALAQPEQDIAALPCCGYTDASAVKWNPLNGVVQCHNCGWNYSQHTWVGLTDDDWKEIEDMPDTFDQGVAWAQAKLKEKNNA